MPWSRVDDSYYDHPKTLSLGTGVTGYAARGAFFTFLSYSARHRTDGWLNTNVITQLAVPQELVKVLLSKGQLHRRNTRCKCRDGRKPPADADLLIHDFLDFHPTRAENDLEKAKRAELRDPGIKQAVRTRDRGMCRYCLKAVNFQDRRSPDGGVLDHIDPTKSAGDANLVVACRSCNGRKGKRTPDEAGMVLYPSPAETPRLRPVPTTDETTDQINDGSKTVLDPSQIGSRSVTDPVADPGTGLSADQINDQRTDGPGRDGSGTGRAPQIRAPDSQLLGGSAGPDAARPTTHVPRRSDSQHPSPYLRSGHQPPEHSPPPRGSP